MTRPRKPISTNIPLVKQMWGIVEEKKISPLLVTKKAGLAMNSLWDWRKGTQPGVQSFNYALNVMGYELKIVPLEASQNGVHQGRMKEEQNEYQT